MYTPGTLCLLEVPNGLCTFNFMIADINQADHIFVSRTNYECILSSHAGH